MPGVMARGLLLATVATLGISGVAQAEEFQCGRAGGDFTYGLEANVAGLDMQANAAASVRDIALNTYETLVTRDENMKPDGKTDPDFMKAFEEVAQRCDAGSTAGGLCSCTEDCVGRRDGDPDGCDA